MICPANHRVRRLTLPKDGQEQEEERNNVFRIVDKRNVNYILISIALNIVSFPLSLN